MSKIVTLYPSRYETRTEEDGSKYDVLVEPQREEVRDMTPEELSNHQQLQQQVQHSLLIMDSRRERDELLRASDLLVLPDRWATMTQDQQQALTDYRQALRDVPQQAAWPDTIEWPQCPQ
jgi:hypothetical protein